MGVGIPAPRRFLRFSLVTLSRFHHRRCGDDNETVALAELEPGDSALWAAFGHHMNHWGRGCGRASTLQHTGKDDAVLAYVRLPRVTPLLMPTSSFHYMHAEQQYDNSR